MKKLFLFLVFFPNALKAQEATIHFDIENSTALNIEVSLFDSYANPEVLFGELYMNVPLANGKSSSRFPISDPVSIKVYYEASDHNKSFEYYFYLSPGDNIRFSIDENNLETSIVVSGIGFENNQPLVQQIHDDFILNLFDSFDNYSLPNRVFKEIEEKKFQYQNILEDYIAKYKPTKEFIRNETFYVQYSPLSQFISFKGRQRILLNKAYNRNEDKWQSIEDSLNC